MVATIVVPLDGTDLATRAIDPGIELARRFGATLTLFGAAGDDFDEVAAALDRRADRITGCPVETIIHQGFESCGLARAVEHLDEPVVCMASDVAAGADETIGPVAEDAIEAGRAPVLLIGPACEHPVLSVEQGQIVVCVDGSAAASSIEPTVTEWAAALALDVHLVTVLHPTRRDLGGVPVERVLREVDSLAFRLRRRGLTVATHTLDNVADPAYVIGRYLHQHPAVAATSTRGHRHTLHAIVGDTVDRLVRSSPVPVLVTRPPTCHP